MDTYLPDLAPSFPAGPTATLVGTLAMPVEPWRPDISAVEADARFQHETISAAVISVGPPADLAVLTRTQLHLQMTGPKGYGRALHTRSTVKDLLRGDSLVLPADATVVESAHAALHRPASARYDDIAIRWEDGRVGLLPVSALMEELAKEFATVALHDPLTRLPNRAALRQRLEMCEAGHRQFAILLLDLDGFKTINDVHGHHAGDDVLVETAQRLRTTVASDDLVVRLGGDEFVVLVTGHPDPAAVEELAGRILARLSLPIIFSPDVTETVGVSIGAIVARGEEISGSEALKAADRALYDAKRTGKGRLRWGQATRPAAEPLPAGH